ncbi:glycine oxidase [Halopolyspora algeriensis]|uniref:glycine oxidase n=1 Tax=Halopolyspora algeriensis TaxID=1500506 RepID=A0A368VRR8_9ACTN|nr:glycine oxidase ThiO [Halopolyspora algeriensis]RCW43552.1 glycine oxidase [Halopolyspora algeriensis]TQM46421.1 glycine oxidase [Halopolyspora algeriensis]TQM47663.1 glycine oxidase [Halopolyspora algeriensis]
MSRKQDRSVAVVGGGVIGLSTAWRLAVAGHRVRLIDPAPASGGASRAAGGMLAPVAEAWPGEESLLELGTASLHRWPEFAERLGRDSGKPSGLRDEGTLVVAADSADRAELDTLADYLASLGRTVNRHSSRRLRRLEPALGPGVRGGLEVPGDLAVDNRATLEALRAAAEVAGVEFVRAAARGVRSGTVELVDAADPEPGLSGSVVHCDVVVIAAGVQTGALHPALRGAIRPVKGEILRLRARSTSVPPPRWTVRGPVHGRQVYLVPREDGMVIGATQYEAGYDTEVTVGGVRNLLADAERFVPGITEYALVETAAGLRPSTEDNLPLLGWVEPGVLVAAGHHRNGFLLAPITAETVVGLVSGDEVATEAKAADPSRSGGQQ